MELSIVPSEARLASLLSPDERVELQAHETVIEKALASFVDAGEALTAIRHKRLYRETHETFETYCQDRWALTSRRAEQLIQGAEIVENIKLRTTVRIVELPTNERQARELAKLPPEKQAEAWAEAVATAPEGKVTAAHTSAVVKKHVEPKPKPQKHPAAKPTPRARVRKERVKLEVTRDPFPEGVPPRVQEFAESFEDGLIAELGENFPTIDSLTWEGIRSRLRDRLLSLFTHYNLSRAKEQRHE